MWKNLILIILVLTPASVHALYVTDENGNTKKCIDISENGSWYQEYHKYEIKYDVKEHYNLKGTSDNSYYVYDIDGYPKPLYQEKGISPYGYRKDSEDSTRIYQLRDIYKLEEPEGKHVHTAFMSSGAFTLTDAANQVASQELWYESFVPHADCTACTEKGLIEYYDECITCPEWDKRTPVFGYDPDKIIAGKKGYLGCLPCPEGTEYNITTEKCIDANAPAEANPPVTTQPPTTSPPETISPTTILPQTTLPPTTQPPDESKTPDDLGPYDENKNYCGPNNFIAYSGHILTEETGDFGKSCYNHDKCYSSSGISREDCDLFFLSDMEDECQYKEGWKGYTCLVAAQLAYRGVWTIGSLFYEK
ncbi:hypothetical protein KKA03_06910 [archaeon]|nr:hypothetical protein [archaeon]